MSPRLLLAHLQQHEFQSWINMSNDILIPVKPKARSIHHQSRMQDLTIKIHTDENIFSKLEFDWKNLAERSQQLICMSPEWAASWWHHFGSHKRRTLFIVTVYDNQKLVAILPFYKGVTSLGKILIQERLQLIGSGGSTNEQFGFSDIYGISDFLDLIVDPHYESRIALLFVKLLNTPEFSNLHISFNQARDDSFIIRTLYPLLDRSSRLVHAERTDVCYYIELDREGGFQAFIKKSKSNARRRFRQTLRARGVENEYIIVEPDSILEVEQVINRLISMHQNRWNTIGYPGAFHDERFINFFKEITLRAYKDHRLWLREAVDSSGVCSVRMLLMYNGRFYDYMSGYDENSSSAKYRPGIGLLLNVIESSFDLPIDRIELLRGNEGYKHDFTNLFLNNWTVTIGEKRNEKSGWRVLAGAILLCSILYKHLDRERVLLKVQYRKGGYIRMFPKYIKFRVNTLFNKMNNKN